MELYIIYISLSSMLLQSSSTRFKLRAFPAGPEALRRHVADVAGCGAPGTRGVPLRLGRIHWFQTLGILDI